MIKEIKGLSGYANGVKVEVDESSLVLIDDNSRISEDAFLQCLGGSVIRIMGNSVVEKTLV